MNPDAKEIKVKERENIRKYLSLFDWENGKISVRTKGHDANSDYIILNKKDLLDALRKSEINRIKQGSELDD